MQTGRRSRRGLHPVGARAGDRALRRVLQPPPAARVASERDTGGRLRGAAGSDLGPPYADHETEETRRASVHGSLLSRTTLAGGLPSVTHRRVNRGAHARANAVRILAPRF